MKELPHTRSCFVCGEFNPLGFKMRFETDGRIVHSRFVAREEHVGFKRTIHGGLMATVLDEIMVWACAVQTGQFAYCAELTVRFLTPLEPGETVLVSSELVADRRGKIFEASAELRRENGQKLATATGKYLPIRAAELADMATDFIGDPGWVIEPKQTRQKN